MFTLNPVAGNDFVNREKLIEAMVAELGDLKSRDGFAIYGMRRVGKSSVFIEVARRLKENKKIVPVYFSVWRLSEFTVEEFCNLLTKEIIDAYRPLLGLKYRASELLNAPLSMLRKISSVGVIYEDIEFLVSFSFGREREGENIEELVERTFALPEKLARNTETKCVLMIDEFPDIVNLEYRKGKIGIGIVRKIRTLCEGWKRTALCISGSIRSTMELVVLSSASPFYKQFIIREVKPLEDKYVEELLRRHLDISERAVVEICRFSGGIPFYVHALGKILARKKGKVTLRDVVEAEREFLSEEGNLIFLGDFERLSSKEKMVLLRIAAGTREIKKLRAKLGDRVSNVSAVVGWLEDKGILVRKERGVYYIADPVFEEWLALRSGARSFTQEILEALRVPRSMEELYALFPERPESSVKSTVYRLVNRGLVRKVGKGKYCKK